MTKDRRSWEDTDGARLEVFRWARKSGRVIFDTNPDAEGIDTMCELTREQVQELIKFLKVEDG